MARIKYKLRHIRASRTQRGERGTRDFISCKPLKLSASRRKSRSGECRPKGTKSERGGDAKTRARLISLENYAPLALIIRAEVISITFARWRQAGNTIYIGIRATATARGALPRSAITGNLDGARHTVTRRGLI